MKFPTPDPIPIPAPVWLMKTLSLLTLTLHFIAVMILVGSLILVIYHQVRGRQTKSSTHLTASNVIARRLTVLMTFTINLGVPPLLFLQVLYGQSVYSSSVLIGTLWFAVIFLLMAAYWLLYRTQAWIADGKAAWIPALISLILVMIIGRIYTMNMTLMLRPEVWNAMYQASPSGLLEPKGDPTMTPRWLFVMSGGLVFGGLWAMLHAGMKHLTEDVQSLLTKTGGLTTAIGAFIQLGTAAMVMSSQPNGIVAGIQSTPMYAISGYLTIAGIAVAALVALVQGMKGKPAFWMTIIASVFGFLGNAGAAIVRDGIRDLTLKPKGFDVMNRVEASNWGVIAVFLLLFVIMLGVIVWLLNVMKQATPPQEQINI